MKTVIKSGATVQVIEAPSKELAIESFEHEFKGRRYEVIEVTNQVYPQSHN